MQPEQGKHSEAHQQVQPLHLATHIPPPAIALETAPNRHRGDHRQQDDATDAVPEHRCHAPQPEGADHPREGNGGEHFVEAAGHGEKGHQAAGQQVVPTDVVETTAGNRQGQKAKDPFLKRIERPHHIKGNGDDKEADGEVHQIRMNR